MIQESAREDASTRSGSTDLGTGMSVQ